MGKTKNRRQMMQPKIILLNKAEVQSGLDRQRSAELLITQLPKDHDGRNTWLLNYGIGKEAQMLRDKHPRKPKFIEKFRSAETISS